ncbi:MAG: hypothetical protein AAFR51_11470 [Pseudomonadota bacterium]
MKYSSDPALAALTARFLELSLPKPEWTHEAHFAVAFCLLADSTRDAFTEMPDLIRAYNKATGVANSNHEGYHETITLASLKAAQHHLSGGPLHKDLARLMHGRYGSSKWMLDHWSRERLFSVEARISWCAPDLAPLSF